MSDRRIKYLAFEFPNGEIFHVPAEIIAEDRTNYYICQIEEFDKDSKEWQDEFEYSLMNKDLLVDWFTNNMAWDDIDESAIKIQDQSEPHYQSMINSGDMSYKSIFE